MIRNIIKIAVLAICLLANCAAPSCAAPRRLPATENDLRIFSDYVSTFTEIWLFDVPDAKQLPAYDALRASMMFCLTRSPDLATNIGGSTWSIDEDVVDSITGHILDRPMPERRIHTNDEGEVIFYEGGRYMIDLPDGITSYRASVSEAYIDRGKLLFVGTIHSAENEDDVLNDFYAYARMIRRRGRSDLILVSMHQGAAPALFDSSSALGAGVYRLTGSDSAGGMEISSSEDGWWCTVTLVSESGPRNIAEFDGPCIVNGNKLTAYDEESGARMTMTFDGSGLDVSSNAEMDGRYALGTGMFSGRYSCEIVR